MVSVDACRVLADGTKIARHFTVILPFLLDVHSIRAGMEGEDEQDIQEQIAERIRERIHFGDRDSMYSGFLDIAIEWMANARIIAGIRPYASYHQMVKDRLQRIQKPYILFTTGASADVSERSLLGYDFYSMRNEFSNRLVQALADEPGENFQDIAVIPITPVLQPTHFTDRFLFTAYNVFEPVILSLTEDRAAEGRIGFGSARKSAQDIAQGTLKPGFAQHDLMLYDSATAKENVSPQRRQDLYDLLGPLTEDELDLLIERSCAFNRHIAAMMYGKMIDALEFPMKGGKKQIDLAASKTGPYYKIMELAVKYYACDAELSYWSRTFMRDIEMPVQRESHPTAVSRIMNRIRGRVVPKDETDNLSDML